MNKQRAYKRVGITGGMGSGKSVVSRVLRSMGYAVYDADAHSKWLCDYSVPLRAELTSAFGVELFKNGGLDRKLFASLIFSDTEKLALANRIIHPYVVNDFLTYCRHKVGEPDLFDDGDENRMDGMVRFGDERDEKKRRVLFVESAILLQCPLRDVTDVNVLVKTGLEERLRRVSMRDGCDREQALRRMNAQMREDAMMAECGFVIHNEEGDKILPQIEEMLSFVVKNH